MDRNREFYSEEPSRMSHRGVTLRVLWGATGLVIANVAEDGAEKTETEKFEFYLRN